MSDTNPTVVPLMAERGWIRILGEQARREGKHELADHCEELLINNPGVHRFPVEF